MNRVAIVCGAAGLLIGACSMVETEYDTKARASFTYRLVSTKQALRTALQSPGFYCTITAHNSQYIFENNAKQIDTDNMLAVNNGTPYISRGAGFIVGKASGYDKYGNFAPLYAFDRLCPYCYDYTHRQLRLTFTEEGNKVKCASINGCGRIYNLDQGGYLENKQSPTDPKLFRYHITYDGMNILQIYN